MKIYVISNTVPPNSLEMKNVTDKSCMENQKAQFMFKNFFPENLAFMGSSRPELTVTVSIQGFFLR